MYYNRGYYGAPQHSNRNTQKPSFIQRLYAIWRVISYLAEIARQYDVPIYERPQSKNFDNNIFMEWTSGATIVRLNRRTNELAVEASEPGRMRNYGENDPAPWASFKNEIQSIYVTRDVQHIGDFAFDGMTYCTKITISTSVTSIGVGAFRNCTSATSIALNAEIKELRMSVFEGCESVVELTIPNTVESLGESALKGCKRLEKIVLSRKLVKIGDYALSECESLTVIQDGDPGILTRIENAIDRFLFKAAAFVFKVIGNVFELIGNVFKSIFSALLPESGGELLNLVAELSDVINTMIRNIQRILLLIPMICLKIKIVINECLNSIMAIIAGFFENLGIFRAIESFFEAIGNVLTELSQEISNSLRELLGDAISSIFEVVGSVFGAVFGLVCLVIGSFFGAIMAVCAWIGSVFSAIFGGATNVFPGSVAYLGEESFSECISLTRVTLGKNVRFIGQRAFRDCKSLVAFDVPKYVTVISTGTFIGCISLKEVTFKGDVVKISPKAFAECKSLSDFKLPTSLTTIDNEAFVECSSIREISIPRAVTYIGKEAFYKCKNLNQVVILSETKVVIGNNAFARCKELNDFVFCGFDVEVKGDLFTLTPSLKTVSTMFRYSDEKFSSRITSKRAAQPKCHAR